MRLIEKSLTESVYNNLKLNEGSFGDEVGFAEDADLELMEEEFAKKLCSILDVKEEYAQYITFNRFELHRGTSWTDDNAWMLVELELDDSIIFDIIEKDRSLCPTAYQLDSADDLTVYSSGISIGRVSGMSSYYDVDTYATIEPHYSFYEERNSYKAKEVEKELDKETVNICKYISGKVKESYNDLLNIMLDNEYYDEEPMNESNEGKILREPDMERAKGSIRDWYTKNFPNDDLGKELPADVTFNDMFEALDKYRDIYELMYPADDSVIRERLFSELADIMGTDYDYVYNQWLKAEDEPKEETQADRVKKAFVKNDVMNYMWDNDIIIGAEYDHPEEYEDEHWNSLYREALKKAEEENNSDMVKKIKSIMNESIDSKGTLDLDEYNALDYFLNNSKLLDSGFYINQDKNGKDFFVDAEDNNKKYSLEDGLKIIYDAIVPEYFAEYPAEAQDGLIKVIKKYLNKDISSWKDGNLNEATDEELEKLKKELRSRADDLSYNGEISGLSNEDINVLANIIKQEGFFISNNIFTDSSDEYEWEQINMFLDNKIREYIENQEDTEAKYQEEDRKFDSERYGRDRKITLDDIWGIVNGTGAKVVVEDIEYNDNIDELVSLINSKNFNNSDEVIEFIETSNEVNKLRESEEVRKNKKLKESIDPVESIGKIENIDGKDYYISENTFNGYCFKDVNAYNSDPDKVCYITEDVFEELGNDDNNILVEEVEANKDRLIEEGGISTKRSIMDEVRTMFEAEEYYYEYDNGDRVEAKDFDERLIEEIADDAFSMVDWQTVDGFLQERDWNEAVEDFYEKGTITEAAEVKDNKDYVYYFIVGICLDDNRPNADENDFYDMKDFGIPYKLMDENMGVTKGVKEAYNYVKNYVETGVPGTFGAVIKGKEPFEGFKDDISGGFNDSLEPGDIYNFKSNGGELVFCEYSTKDGVKTVADTVYNEMDFDYVPSIKTVSKVKNLYSFVSDKYNRELFNSDGIDEDVVDLVKKLEKNLLRYSSKEELIDDVKFIIKFVEDNKEYFHDSIDREIVDDLNSIIETADTLKEGAKTDKTELTKINWDEGLKDFTYYRDSENYIYAKNLSGRLYLCTDDGDPEIEVDEEDFIIKESKRLNKNRKGFLKERYFPGSEEQYFCSDCGLAFNEDQLTSTDDEGNDLCPACGSTNIIDTGVAEDLKESAEFDINKTKSELNRGNVIVVSKKGYTPTSFIVIDGGIYFNNSDISFGWNKHPDMNTVDELLDFIEKKSAEGFTISCRVTESINEAKKPSKKKKKEKKDEKRVIMQQGNVTCFKENANKFLVFENENDNEKEYKDQESAMTDFLSRVGVDSDNELSSK